MGTVMVTATGTVHTVRPRGRRHAGVSSGLAGAAIAGLLLLTAGAEAAEGWRSELGARTVLSFSDNIFLTQRDPESDVVVELQPYFNTNWRGRVSSAQVAYGPLLVGYLNNGDLSQTWQYLRATGTTEVIEDFFSLTATAQANPNVINRANAGAGFDPLPNPGSYTQTASFSLVPSFTFPLIKAGDYADVAFSPGINLAFSAETAGGSDNASSLGTSTSLSIASGSVFYRMPWSLNYSGDLFDVEQGSGFSRVWGEIGYRFSPRYRLDLLVGVDSQQVGDDFDNAGPGRDLGDGVRWQPRFTWTPNAETSATIGIGQAAFGNDYYLNVSRRQKRFAFGLQYASTVENSRQAILRQQAIPFEDPFGNPILDPIGSGEVRQAINTPTLVEETYVNSGLDAVLAFQGRRTTVSLNATVDWDRYQFSDVETQQSLGSVSVNHRLTPRLSGRAAVLYQTYVQEPDVGLDYDQYRLELALTYRLGRRTTAGLAAYLSQSSSDSEAADVATGGLGSSTRVGQTGNWDENRISLTLSTTL